MPISFGTLAIPIIVLVILLSVLIVFFLFSRNYIKVPPNRAAVFSGRKRKVADGRVVGYRMVKGGAALRISGVQSLRFWTLRASTSPAWRKYAWLADKNSFGG